MKEQLEGRVQSLKQEYEAGQKMLVDLERRQMELQQTLLRISGAIQVLEELLAEEQQTASNGNMAEPNANLVSEKVG